MRVERRRYSRRQFSRATGAALENGYLMAGPKMRIPGLGGEVMSRRGVTPVSLPGAEIFTAMQSGAIDATEWVGPYNDLAFGLHRVAKYCYYPGWQEPGSALECLVNKAAYEALPGDLQALVETCCMAVNQTMLSEYIARNQQALKTLSEEHGVTFLPLPRGVLDGLKQATAEVLTATAQRDPFAAKVYESIRAFQAQAAAWHRISEQAYYAMR